MWSIAGQFTGGTSRATWDSTVPTTASGNSLAFLWPAGLSASIFAVFCSVFQ